MVEGKSVWLDPDVSTSAAYHFEAARRAAPLLSREELERLFVLSLAGQVNSAQALKRVLGRLVELEAQVAALERPGRGAMGWLRGLGWCGRGERWRSPASSDQHPLGG
jgi:hypothetical protein